MQCHRKIKTWIMNIIFLISFLFLFACQGKTIPQTTTVTQTTASPTRTFSLLPSQTNRFTEEPLITVTETNEPYPMIEVLTEVACQGKTIPQTTAVTQATTSPTRTLSLLPSQTNGFTEEPLFTVTETNEPYPMIEVLPEDETETPTPTLDAQTLQEAQVTLNLSRTLYKVGEIVIINVVVANIPQPAYEIILRDEGVQEDTPVAQISATNHVSILENDSKIMELQSANAGNNQLTLQFRAKAVGKTTLTVNAFSENSQTSGTLPAFQMGSAEVLIVVEK